MTYVFPNDLLQGLVQDLPREHFDIFLNISGLRIGKSHDQGEKILGVAPRFRNGDRLESFKVSPDAILFLHREPYSNKRLQEVDGINACHAAYFFLRPPDAADAYPFRRTAVGRNDLEVGIDIVVTLRSPEFDKTSLGCALLSCPSFRHGVQISADMKDRFITIRVQCTCCRGAGAVRRLQSRGSYELGVACVRRIQSQESR